MHWVISSFAENLIHIEESLFSHLPSRPWEKSERNFPERVDPHPPGAAWDGDPRVHLVLFTFFKATWQERTKDIKATWCWIFGGTKGPKWRTRSWLYQLVSAVSINSFHDKAAEVPRERLVLSRLFKVLRQGSSENVRCAQRGEDLRSIGGGPWTKRGWWCPHDLPMGRSMGSYQPAIEYSEVCVESRLVKKGQWSTFALQDSFSEPHFGQETSASPFCNWAIFTKDLPVEVTDQWGWLRDMPSAPSHVSQGSQVTAAPC